MVKDGSLFSNGKYITRLFAGLTGFVSVAAILGYSGLSVMPLGNYKYYLGLCFPWLFNIKRLEIRNALIVLSITALLLCRGWHGFICIVITIAVLFWKEKKLLVTLFLAGVLVLPFASKEHSERWVTELSGRSKIYERTVQLWQNRWWGEGMNSFQKLPENQPAARADHLWLHTAHSDFLQGLFEIGIIRSLMMVFLLIVPLLYAEMETREGRVAMAGYLCLWSQYIFNFPFHRPITAIIGAIIILNIYTRLRILKCK